MIIRISLWHFFNIGRDNSFRSGDHNSETYELRMRGGRVNNSLALRTVVYRGQSPEGKRYPIDRTTSL